MIVWTLYFIIFHFLATLVNPKVECLILIFKCGKKLNSSKLANLIMV